ncbi:MAG: hypothetical protein OEL76_09890 [Siculibacillus sp.]|nr:hypothetical protein [Siculibacillus sp.]
MAVFSGIASLFSDRPNARRAARRPDRARWAVVVAVFAALVGATVVPAAADGRKAEGQATIEQGFGRLVITFRDGRLVPQFNSRMSNGVLVLDFVEPVEIDIERAVATLSTFVTVARPDPGGHGLRMALARQVKVNTMEAGEKLFVDFLPAKWAGPPPPLPPEVVAELAKRAEAAMKAAREAEMARTGSRIQPRLDFKIGRLPTFTRFSFGWNVPFDTRMSREDDRITVTFNHSAKIDLAPIDLEPVPGLKDVFADGADDRLKVVFTVAPDADVRGFRDADSYVVDLVHAGPPTNPGEAAVRKVLAENAGKGRDRVTMPGVAQAKDVAGETSAPSAAVVAEPPVPPPAPIVAAKPEAPAPAPVVPSKPVAADPVSKPSGPVAPATATAPATPAVPEATVSTRETVLPATDVAPPPTAAEKPANTVSDAPAGELPAAAVPTRSAGERLPVRVEAKRIGNIVRMNFPFPSRIAGAAFKRDETLWVVFDTDEVIDIEAIAPNLGPLAGKVGLVRSNGWQALRIGLTEPLLTTLGADGNSWILTIGEMVLEPARPLKLRRFVRADGNASLKVELPDGGTVHEIADPDVGDRIAVVTAHGPARGLLKVQNFVDVETLPSAHGIAVVPRGDDLQVTLENGVVTIGRERGLNLSTGSLERSEGPVPRSQTGIHRIPVDPRMFDRSDAPGFEDRARSLLKAVIETRDGARRQARIDLAEFYIGHRFAPEALAQLRILAAEEPGVTADPGFIVLFGAAQTLAGRGVQAREALSRSEVQENSDGALWRTIAAADQARWDDARENALKATGVLGAYPRPIQNLFNLAAAEASIELNDFGNGEARLAEIETESLTPDLAGRFENLQARLADAGGRNEDAAERWKRARATGDRRAQAEADYRETRALARDGKIEREEAIDRMKSLAFGWRGDEIELRTLRFLAGLLADGGQYRDAFQAMRSAVMVAPNSETTRLLQDEMGRRFLALYLDDADKALQPVEALSLYYDFREMVPIGRRGDEVVRKLADRLVAVDLLPQAAELLSYQVDNRLKGAARAQIAADLAVIHLLDRKPDRALAVLNKTRQSQLPLSLERQRRLVEVRALADAGRLDTALELLSSLTGNDALRLRADILWKGKRWREAGEKLEAMLGGRWSDKTPLDDQERQDVLRAAIAYALANDQLQLDRLRAKFGTKMAESPNARTFDVVTRPIQTQGGEFREIAKELASVDTMRRFLEEYRAQYLDPKATTIAPEPEAPKKPEAAPKPAAEAPGKAAPAKPEAKVGKPDKVASADAAATASPEANEKKAGR